MNNYTAFLKKFGTQVQSFWVSLSITRKITLGGVLALISAGMLSVFFIRNDSPFEYIFTDVSAEDTQSILTEFKRQNFTEYDIDSKGIKVPVERAAKLRMQLAQEGLPS
ncbi:MAG: hypothetical protein WCO71_10985, partial [Pseudomonadota bacterium]